MLRFLFIAIIFFFQKPVFAQDLTHEQLVKIALTKMESMDKIALPLKPLKNESYEHFIKSYINPFVDTEKYRNTSLQELLQDYRNDSRPPIFDYAHTIEIANRFLDFTQPGLYYTFLIDVKDGPKVLAKSMLDYSAGLMINIERLENTDLKHTQEIQQLKKIILRRILTFETSHFNLPSWELIHFQILIIFFTNFPANITNELGMRLDSMVIGSNSNLNNFEKVAASNLLLEISLHCYSSCTLPVQARKTRTIVSKDYYIKGLFDICERACNKSWLNPRGNGFYTFYLEILRRLHDPNYDDVKTDLLNKDFKSGLKQFLSDIKQVILSPQNKFGHIKIFFSNFISTTKIGILYFFNYFFSLHLWIIFYLFGFYLLCFTGKKRIILKKIIKQSPLRTIKIPFRNLKNAIIKGNELAHRIALNLILIASTLIISNVKTLIENYL